MNGKIWMAIAINVGRSVAVYKELYDCRICLSDIAPHATRHHPRGRHSMYSMARISESHAIIEPLNSL